MDIWCSISKHYFNKSNFPFFDTQLSHRPPDGFSRNPVKSIFEVYKSRIEWLVFSRIFLCICWRMNMVSMVIRSDMKPYCIPLILSDDLVILSMTFSVILRRFPSILICNNWLYGIVSNPQEFFLRQQCYFETLSDVVQCVVTRLV